LVTTTPRLTCPSARCAQAARRSKVPERIGVRRVEECQPARIPTTSADVAQDLQRRMR
jgi:hypothetical protein